MKHLETTASLVFGGIFVLLSLMVAAETLLRKLFGTSLQGVDELGGYALAAGATISFSMALFGRAHMRIDIFHDMLPRTVQSVLNWLSAVLMALFAGVLIWNCLQVVNETLEYGSTAQTPWATPLIYPQSVWFLGLGLFALAAVAYGVRATWLLLSHRFDQLNEEFHPKGVSEELKEELEDFEHRAQEAASQQQREAPEVAPRRRMDAGLTDHAVPAPVAATTTTGGNAQ